jgi:hypothetical protein
MDYAHLVDILNSIGELSEILAGFSFAQSGLFSYSLVEFPTRTILHNKKNLIFLLIDLEVVLGLL